MKAAFPSSGPMTRASRARVRTILMCHAGTALAVLLPAGLAQAQPLASAPTQQADTTEIVVTAQRRAERLEDVPVAITALSADTLASAGVVGLQDVGRIAPGVQVGFGGAFTSPSIRGVSTITNGNNIENNVAVYVDGFYEPNSLVINSDLPNIGSVEILKGPQGTLYGRNATGGAILINTLQPSDIPMARAEITYARFNDKRVSAFVSGPLSDRMRYSVAGYYRDSDSYIKLIDPNQIGGTGGPAAPMRQASVRTKLEVDVAESLTATLAYNYAYANDPRGSLFSTFEHVPATHPKPPLRPTELGTAAYNYETTVPVSTHQGTLKLVLDAGFGTMTSYSGYSYRASRTEFDFDGTYADLVSSTNRFTQDTYQQAVDLVTKPFEGFDLVVGGLYFRDINGTDPLGIQSFGANRRLTTRNLAKAKTDAWAVYADGTYQLTDALSVNVGARYSREKKEVDFTSISFATNPAGTVTFGPVNRDATFSKLTPRASIRYELAPRTNVYASYSQGFRSGTFSLSPPAVVELYNAVRPETVDAYEVGFKTASRLIRFDAAAFYYNYRDLQVNVSARSPFCPAEPAPCGLLITLFDNAPKAEIYGLEAQTTINPTDVLTIRAGASWLHARYREFRNATGTGLNPVTDTNVSSQPQDWSNQQLARAPDFSANLGVEYRVPIGDGGLLFAVNGSYTDSYVISNPSLFGPLAGALADKQRYRQGGYALLNASATWTAPSGHLHVTIFGTNLTDKKYRATYNGGAFGDYSSLGEPAVYGVRAGFNF